MKCSKCGKECFSSCGIRYLKKKQSDYIAVSSCCHAEIIQEEKIQMTEDQAEKMYDDINLITCGIFKKPFIYGLKVSGYIKKSELETLVDEAEHKYYMFSNYKYIIGKYDIINDEWQMYACDLINKMKDTIQAFKTKFPEWDK